jgi:predicted nucleotidyltransferase
MIFIKNAIIENTINHTVSHMDEISNIYETAIKNMDAEIKIPNNVLNSFKIKNELNPEIWHNNKINSEIKNKLIKIAKDFFKNLELPNNIKIKDILFVGSLANYNWSKYSDIDLHILIDFSKFEDKDIIKKFFDSNKNMFNLKHNIKVKGHDLELYVQDTKEKLSASAIYSLMHDKWILMPKEVDFKLDKSLIKIKITKIFDKLKIIKKNYDKKNYQKTIDYIDDLKDYIKKMRQSGLEKGGEFSIENIIFKILRRTDIMEYLDTFKNKAYDNMVSIKEQL